MSIRVKEEGKMYESYTRQALPPKEYRELLGTALCVFNSNNAFIIENILHTDKVNYNWYELIDKESGKLNKVIVATIAVNGGQAIADLFSDLVERRNRIIHSFQITNNDGEQILATKTKVKDGNKQFIITKKYLMQFIKDNEKLSLLLYDYRKSVAAIG